MYLCSRSELLRLFLASRRTFERTNIHSQGLLKGGLFRDSGLACTSISILDREDPVDVRPKTEEAYNEEESFCSNFAWCGTCWSR